MFLTCRPEDARDNPLAFAESQKSYSHRKLVLVLPRNQVGKPQAQSSSINAIRVPVVNFRRPEVEYN